ncbi:LysM domain-containing protein [Vibrio sp. vnigr-6D03]|uniref:LysM peptidoglycan-binding domain-containing protein n=1 Tax=Vibrio sp. vnigr-6D03 TaxID=2058088 RepID=UPI000C32D09F|nr:LysM domain-containing protein [Vibrio sp. vnigr-6D03]PKF81426.1 LysM domain-containing protein [Vibrio sp. vnigr-6D03]
MTTKTYTVKAGDSLIKIAVEHAVSYAELLAANPQYQSNPNHILVGDIVLIPIEEEEDDCEEVCQEPVEPVTKEMPTNEDGCVVGASPCQKMEVCDVIMFTGDAPEKYYVLNETMRDDILKEVSIIDKLMKEFQQISNDAPEGTHTDEKAVEKHRNKRREWLDKAHNGGLIKVDKTSTNSKKEKQDDTQRELKDRIKKLELRKQQLNGYVPFFNDKTDITLKKQVSRRLESEILGLKTLLAKEESKGKTHLQGINYGNLPRGKNAQLTQTVRHGFREAVLVSQNRLIYIREAFVAERVHQWRTNPEQNAMMEAIETGSKKEIAKAMFTDIKNGIAGDADNGVLGKLEQVWLSHTVCDLKWKEWTFNHAQKDDEGYAPYAVSGEAQLMRLTAMGEVKTVFEPKEGKIDLNVKASAAFSLMEGKIEAAVYLPYERGFQLYLNYTDANGKKAVYPFGHFRGKLSAAISCFMGATVSAEATATNKPPEQSAGASVLLAPDVSVGTTKSGGVGISGNAFAGAQAGGQVTGALEWKHPKNAHTTAFDALAEIKAEGNVAFGAGAGFDFGIYLIDGQFTFQCSGRLVFGPGGSGGFGTTVDFEKLWDLAKVCWEALAVIDYRVLNCVNKDAYDYFVQAAYYLYTDPTLVLENAINSGLENIENFWATRMESIKTKQRLEEEAKVVATRICDPVKFTQTRPHLLPPETIGIMLDILVRTYVFNFEEKQEKAINILLSQAINNSWRRFEEALSRMNTQGKKRGGEKALFKNLDRINAILDGKQQDEFTQWIVKLAENDRVSMDAYTTMASPKIYKGPQVKQQVSQLPHFFYL